MGDTENAAWLHGKLIRLGPVSFDYQPEDPLQGWRMQSDNGLLELDFTPEGARRGTEPADRRQPLCTAIGHFNGQIRDPDSGAVRGARFAGRDRGPSVALVNVARSMRQTSAHSPPLSDVHCNSCHKQGNSTLAKIQDRPEQQW